MFIRNTSIQTKLIRLACGSATAAILIACVGFVWHSVNTLCDVKGKQLRDQAEFIAWQAGPILALRDAERGQQLLASFWTNSTVEEARLYGNDRKVLATWGEQKSQTAPAPTPKGYRYTGFSQVEVVQQVVVGSQRLGTIYVRADTSDLREELIAFAKFAGSVVALALLVALLIAIRLQRAISRPIAELAKAAKKVAIDADSTIRVHSNARAELKTLEDAFNHLLARVESSEAAVRTAHLGLQDGVIAKTKELSRELRRHQQVEAELAAAKEAAEAANRAKAEFLTNLSCEIRTPLGGIMRLTEVLADEFSDTSPEDRQECLATLQRHGANLVKLIDDVQDVLKGETGRFETARAAGPPHQIVSDERPTSLPPAGGPGAAAGTPLMESVDAPKPLAGAPSPCDGPLTGRRILVVDDGEANRQLIQKVLRDAGAEVLTANDGLEAIHATDRNRPELILMDLQMPVMDGFSATRELRSNGNALPIIALLSEVMHGQEEKYLQAGFTGYLTKPIDATRLLKLTARELNAAAERVTTSDIVTGTR